MKFYCTILPDESVAYGKLYGFGPIKFHHFLGVRTPDCNENCLHAAIDDIMWLDSDPNIQVYYNGINTVGN